MAPTDRSPSRICAILGMHRSGTSWLAGTLQAHGLELGEVSEQNQHNPKGNRESRVLMRLHDAVLAESGGSWREPPERIKWKRKRRGELADYVAAMNSRFPLWGFKDPRALLLLDAWHEQAGGALVRVGIFRHPGAVHRSLSTRDPSFPASLSETLWCAYNERLVEEHRRDPFPILCFDAGGDRLAAAARRIAGDLGIGAASGESFFDGALVHHGETDATVPPDCRALWNYLREHTFTTGTPPHDD